jgi:hypothetical protein
MSHVPNETLKRLLELARQDNRRRRDNRSHDWRPFEVRNPEEGQTFNLESAWDLIVELLEQGTPFKAVPQRDPPNSVAYVCIHKLSDGLKVYIKLRLNPKGTVIFGRSFHYEEGQFSNE